MKSLIPLLTLSVVGMAMPSQAFAQNTSHQGWTAGLAIGYVLLDKQAASRESVGKSAWAIDLSANYYFSSSFGVGLGLGVINLDDKAGFDQQVTVVGPFDSGVETASSEASGITTFGEVQYWLSPGDNDQLQLKASLGYFGIASSSRKIENCSNCREEDFDLGGGAYLGAGVLWTVENGTSAFGISAKQFVSGDIKNVISLELEYAF